MRIVSLVPSQTELLYHLGADVAGITKFCIHPNEWYRTKIRVGGTKSINIETIRSIDPDLIIANKEENIQHQIETLAHDFPTWLTDINNLEDALSMIHDLGGVTHTVIKAAELVTDIRKSFESLNIHQSIPCAYLIWKDPYMAAGGDTFINDIMIRGGFENVFSSRARYPEITLRDIATTGCKVILLSSEPYPFSEKHITEIKTALPGIEIKLVDGELFSWYGSRLLKTPPYLQHLRNSLGDIIV